MTQTKPGQGPFEGTIARPPKEVVEGFRGLATSTIGNVLDDLSIAGIMLNIKPLAPGSYLLGTAFTAKEVTGVQHSYTAAEFGLGAVVDGAAAGDVIVIDNGGQQVSTWGGVAAFAASRRGVAGLLVDGGVRDVDEIRQYEFPTFSRHAVPLSGKTRVKVIEINTTVKIDGVMVRPGDIIVGDSTGVVCVPSAIAAEVLSAAAKLDEDDRKAIEEIKAGLSFRAALAKFSKL